ncbi:hypothetical protein [Rhizobium sp. Leaf321]|uniref:hypothetical protein n=1 Tax=Rhizobium sp. Leaf321 TaxID=1736335 RepID=UPI00191017B3|nr:hypothetical protein [Rhizobium sp. Leaf321]
MAIEREVLSFIIVPPYAQRAVVTAAKERFEDYLSRRFPGYDFTVGPFAPVGDEDEFCVLPVMNYPGPNGESYMCDPPKRWFVQDIADACASFDLKGTRHFAA